jgi:Photosynthesis system II assembly factor YCF48
VFLSTPQLESTLRTSPVRSTWMGWPALRWGTAAACAVIVVAAVSLRNRSERHATVSEFSSKVVAKLAEPAAEQKTEVAAPAEKDRAALDAKSEVVLPRRDERVSGVARNKISSVPASAAKTSDAAPAAMQSDKLAFSQRPLATPIENQPTVGTLAALAKPAAPAASMDQGETANANLVAAEKSPAVLGKAKEAAQGADLFSSGQGAEAKREMSTVTAAGVSQNPFKKLIPRWTLSADGTLQRSLDAGKTWKVIPVAPDATFTAVAAMSADIWIGGSHGSLYHSSDAGEHWMQVIPVSDGHSLTSNVIGIEFPDSLHGKITTASQEIWATADGGQTWQISK